MTCDDFGCAACGDILTEVGQSCSCAEPDLWGEVPVGVPLAVTLGEQRGEIPDTGGDK